jgi:hypothetical protein
MQGGAGNAVVDYGAKAEGYRPALFAWSLINQDRV